MTQEIKALQPVDKRHLESSIAVALRLAKFRLSRSPLESDEIYARAARAVMESFERAHWEVIHTRDYPGWGPEGSGKFMPQQPLGRCDACDD